MLEKLLLLLAVILLLLIGVLGSHLHFLIAEHRNEPGGQGYSHELEADLTFENPMNYADEAKNDQRSNVNEP